MIIGKKSVQILLRSSIEHNINDFNEEIDFLIGNAKNRPKTQKDFEEIKNIMLYYFDEQKKGKQIHKQSGSKSLISIENNDLYQIYYPEDIKQIDLIYGQDIQRKVDAIISNRNHRDTLINNKISLLNNILLYGEPGTGKTQIAMNIAKTLNLPLVLVRLDEIISSYLGKTGKNIKEIFDIVAKHKCILFFDELDAIGKKRDDNQELGELKRVVTVFLQNLDTVNHRGMIIGATNHPELIDKALWRRFDIYIETQYPSKNDINKIFNSYLNEKVKLTLTEKKLQLGDLIDNVSGAYIEKISDHINRVCIISNDYSIITILRSFLENLDNNLYGNIKQSNKYKIAKNIYENGISLKEIEEIMNIPYTTLRDNILKK